MTSPDTTVDSPGVKGTLGRLGSALGTPVPSAPATGRGGLDGFAPAGIYQDTVAVVDAGMQDSMTKGRSIKAALHSLADDIEDHVRGVRSDEADASMQFSYGSDI